MSTKYKSIQTIIIHQKRKSDYNGGTKDLPPFLLKMQTTIIILIAVAMIITSIVNFAKPAYQEFV